MSRLPVYTLAALLLLVGLTAKSQVLNIEQKRMSQDSAGLSGSAKAALGIYRNTSDVFYITGQANCQYIKGKNIYMVIGSYDIFRADDDKLLDKSVQHIRYNRPLTKQLIAEVFVQNQYNRKMGIQNRKLAGLGPRISLVDKSNMNINTALLYMFEHESLSEYVLVSNDHRMSTYVSGEIELTPTLKFIHTTYMQPLLRNWADYRVLSQSALQFHVWKNIKCQITYNIQYDTQPAPETPRTSYSLLNEVLVKF